MSKIIVPKTAFATVKTVSEFLAAIDKWYQDNHIKLQDKSLSGIWYRGMGTIRDDALQPGVYRKEFNDRMKSMIGKVEEKRRNLEREMHDEFKTTGAHFLKGYDTTEQYFIAQHFGMRTRLLDWTTNPLAGLFFAVENQAEKDQHDKDGEVFVMEATGVFAAKKIADPTFRTHIRGMWHPDVRKAIEEAITWKKVTGAQLIMPVRPDYQPGRIGQQNSCFTMHMHNSTDCENPTLARITIPHADGTKKKLLQSLHRMNINQFTIYGDLDNLSRSVKKAWGV